MPSVSRRNPGLSEFYLRDFIFPRIEYSGHLPAWIILTLCRWRKTFEGLVIIEHDDAFDIRFAGTTPAETASQIRHARRRPAFVFHPPEVRPAVSA